MPIWHNIICGCESFISTTCMHLYFLILQDQKLKKTIRDKIKRKKRRSVEMTSIHYRKHKNAISTHITNAQKIQNYIEMAKFSHLH